MKSFPWNPLLHQHPIFASLTEQEITALLQDEASQERAFPKDRVILKGGEDGDSLFLLGSGSVQIALGGTEGSLMPVAVLQTEEIFGEMAILERKPRSATVVALEPCVLLEIAGAEIRKLLDTHPAMQVQLYTLVRDRLQQWFQNLEAGKTR